MRRNLVVAVALTGSAEACSAPLSASAPGTRLWVARFLESGSSGSSAMAVSLAGGRVFVAGDSYGGPATGVDYQTVAYRSATGRRLWASRYSGPRRNLDDISAVAVSPAGGSVFVTGSTGGPRGAGYATVAYAAATGRRLWVSRYGNGGDGASAVAVSPSGSVVYVTGFDDNGGGYATVAYSAVTGKQLWVSRYRRPGSENAAPAAVAVSPGGGTVFVTGSSNGRMITFDYVTVAYNAATGRQLWAGLYNGPGDRNDDASAMAVSPGGGRVFVTGDSYRGPATGVDYATVAYMAATGRQLWVRRYNGAGTGFDGATAVAVSPDGAAVFVTGQSMNRGSGYGYATVAYRAATGRQLWASRYRGDATSVAASPDGATVYVTGAGSGTGGHCGGYATVAYAAATGRRLWVGRYGVSDAVASSVEVSPGGRRVFVTGLSRNYATVAYRGWAGGVFAVRDVLVHDVGAD